MHHHPQNAVQKTEIRDPVGEASHAQQISDNFLNPPLMIFTVF
jgi:hypothetical protein